MEDIVKFFDSPFFVLFGGISCIVGIFGFLYGVYLIFKNVLPIWIRLGIGFSNRKIAIYAEQEFQNLKDLLVDSGLFKENNINRIDKNALSKGDEFSVKIVYFNEFEEHVNKILQVKKDKDVLIVYAANGLRIEPSLMSEIGNHRNTIVTTFRGRLLNDIVSSLITTVYEKR